MQLSDLITITITKNTRTVAKAGFGIPLILSATATWSERTRTYTSLSGVAVDFAAGTPEYLAAQAIFAQDPHPPQVIIGRANDAAPTQQYEFTPNVINSYTYLFTVTQAGVTHVVQYTSDGTATAAEITLGLKTAFDALSLSGITSSQQNTNQTLRLLANAAGTWFGIGDVDSNMVLLQDHAANGAEATALDAILKENGTWYGLASLYNSKAVVQAIAAWAESNKKLYLPDTNDSAARDHVLSGASDVAYQLHNSAYTHSSLWWEEDTASMLGAGVLGAVLPLDPGSETWAFKQVNGVPASQFTETQITNLQAKKANFYTALSGLNITFEGFTADGEYVDVIRLIDFMEARLSEEIFGALANARKIPFTNKGIVAIGGAIERVLKQIANTPFEGIEPDYTVTLPDVSTVSPSDKAARTLNGVGASCTLTGAIHRANLEVNVSV